MVVLVAAAGENNSLGLRGELMWHLPDDFKHFKNITSGSYIIMGRKTFETFRSPLPNRTHIIITRKKDYKTPEGCIVVNSLEDALKLTEDQENVFVIGGGEIYTLALASADKIELTRVHEYFEADAFFPVLNTKEWNLVSEEKHYKDKKHLHDFTFQTWIRK